MKKLNIPHGPPSARYPTGRPLYKQAVKELTARITELEAELKSANRGNNGSSPKQIVDARAAAFMEGFEAARKLFAN